MKKNFFFLTAYGVFGVFGVLALLLSGCASKPPLVVEENTQTYSNGHYQFSVSYPESYSYCLNHYCYNEIPEDVVTLFLLKNESGSKVMNMQGYVNLTGLSATEYAKQSLELNRQNGEALKDAYSEEEEIDFAGEAAYTFLATNGFEERGGRLGTDEKGYVALVMDSNAEQEPALNFSFPGQMYRAIYVGHGPYIYRILYLDTEEIEAVLDSFVFLE